MQGSSSQKYSQMSKKIEVKATKKKGRMLVAKEQIEPGKHFFMRFPIRIGFQDFMKSDLIFYKSTFQRGILALEWPITVAMNELLCLKNAGA